MKKHFALLPAALLLTIVMMNACQNKQEGKSFNSKEDSVQFAKTVIEQYPNSFLETGDTSILPTKPGGLQPIPWDTVLAYKNYYDKDPKLFNLENLPYKGFNIDPDGYRRIMKNAKVKGIYLRMGRRPSGEYTIMLLGTDSSGKIVSQVEVPALAGNETSPKDTTDYDHLEPCPTNCPDIDN